MSNDSGPPTVADAVARPYSLVAYSVYVVVLPGVTATLVPRTGPDCGEMTVGS